ncbi:MAG TPA: hypothetical protein DDZ39_03900 [Flavobacteriaceae bacterium]|jgi:hypothetical protein|nr:hypothetical protein [Flavobacteriaceae bacterium]HBS12101.1 hypothetical protein [Flavobacteriaceae bacterium]
MCGKLIKQIITIVFLGILLSSCKQIEKDRGIEDAFESQKETPSNEDKQSNEKNVFVADLPIKIDSSSNFIVFQINELVEAKNKGKLKYSSRDSYKGNYLKNLIFQNMETEEMNVLTTSKINITSYEQLYNANNEAEEVILYQVIDTFSEDKEALVLSSLYLSTSDGKKFKKISLKNHQLSSWTYFPEMRKIFFKTVVDSDDNNKLDNLDKHYMYSVSLDDFKSTELLKEEFKMISH